MQRDSYDDDSYDKRQFEPRASFPGSGADNQQSTDDEAYLKHYLNIGIKLRHIEYKYNIKNN